MEFPIESTSLWVPEDNGDWTNYILNALNANDAEAYLQQAEKEYNEKKALEHAKMYFG